MTFLQIFRAYHENGADSGYSYFAVPGEVELTPRSEGSVQMVEALARSIAPASTTLLDLCIDRSPFLIESIWASLLDPFTISIDRI